MIEKPIVFYSEGSKLTGTLYFPENSVAESPAPALIVNSGYQGFNAFYPKMFARQLTEMGYVCLGFDYRGFADSEGEQGKVLIEQQVADIRNAFTYLSSQENVDDQRIGLIGWGMGAANVILATEKIQRVAAVASLNGFYVGERWLQSIHSYTRWIQILEEVENDRKRRVFEGTSQQADTFAHYPLDPATQEYVQKELAPVDGFGNQTQVQFTESIIDMNVEEIVDSISPTPLFIAHGRRNLLHPYDEAVSLYKAATSPKTLYSIEGMHNDFMYSENTEFLKLCEQLNVFFGEAFERSASPQQILSA